MNFLLNWLKSGKHVEMTLTPEDEELYKNLQQASEGSEGSRMHLVWDVCRLLAVHDHKLPVAYKVIARLGFIDDVLHRLQERKIIIFDLEARDVHGRLVEGYFHLKNPRLGDIVRKRMTNEQYYNALFWTLKGINEYVKFREYDKPDPFGLSGNMYRIALPQAIHVWKQALYYDDLVEKYWNVPIDMLKYMANVKLYTSEAEYAPVRQFAKESQPAFERLFPDPAPLYKRLSFAWLLYDWEEFWDAIHDDGDDRKRFTKRKQRLNFYADYQF